MEQDSELLLRLGYVEPFEHESISHYLGRLRRFKANSLPSAYSLGQAAGIGGVTSRWEKLYFNPFPTEQELGSIASLINLDTNRFWEMLPQEGVIHQPRPIMLCGACYSEVPCHRMEWQYKAESPACDSHRLQLLHRCPSCKTPFRIPSLWEKGECHHCRMPFSAMAKKQKRVR